MLRAGSAVAGLERGGHDFEPAKTAVSKLGLGLKRSRLRPISPLSPPPLRQLLLSILVIEQGDSWCFNTINIKLHLKLLNLFV